MKKLSEDRLKLVFEKLAKFIGSNIQILIDRPDGAYCFREKKNRVFYVNEKILRVAETFNKDQLVCVGAIIGKFTKAGNFKLLISALDYIAPYAQHKVWVKTSFEQQFLYGNHIPKSALGRITENTPQYAGVVVYSMNDLPLGFGVAARSTANCKTADPLTIVCFHQADVGEYLRNEEGLF